jgi:hypothetical protein
MLVLAICTFMFAVISKIVTANLDTPAELVDIASLAAEALSPAPGYRFHACCGTEKPLRQLAWQLLASIVDPASLRCWALY